MNTAPTCDLTLLEWSHAKQSGSSAPRAAYAAILSASNRRLGLKL